MMFSCLIALAIYDICLCYYQSQTLVDIKARNTLLPKLTLKLSAQNRNTEEIQEPQKLSSADKARTFLEGSNHFGILSTISSELEDYPVGSMVLFEIQDDGKPFFAFSTLAAHTNDLKRNKKASLTVVAPTFKGASTGRVTITGEVFLQLNRTITLKLRDQFLQRHKEAYWVDFGDFSFYLMEKIESVRYFFSFANDGIISTKEYQEARPDFVYLKSDEITKMLNDTKSDQLVKLISEIFFVTCKSVKVLSVDRKGLTVKAELYENTAEKSKKLRLNFSKEADNFEDIEKDLSKMENF